MRAASQAVLWHGGAAAVFAVGEAQEAAAFAALPGILGRPFLRALGLVSQHAVQRPSFLPQDVDFAVIRPPPPPPASVRQALQGDGGRVQWHKLREAWRLMEAGEARDGARFELVAKLRFDCVPLFETPRLCPTCLDASRGLTIHAASDKSFWGSRAAMAIAAAMHDGLISAAPPVGPRADPLSRVVAVGPMLHAALSLPDAAWSLVKAERQHLNKVAMLPFPADHRVHRPRPAATRQPAAKQPAARAPDASAAGARRATIAQLRGALAAGHAVFDPLAALPLPRHVQVAQPAERAVLAVPQLATPASWGWRVLQAPSRATCTAEERLGLCPLLTSHPARRTHSPRGGCAPSLPRHVARSPG